MIKAVIFDLDGVLIDSEVRTIKIKRDMLEEVGIKLTLNDMKQFAGRAFAKALPEIYPEIPNIDKFLSDYHDRAYSTVKYKDLEMPYASELLSQLKSRGYKIAMVTASNKEKIATVLNELGWEGVFDYIGSGEDGYPAKPASDCYIGCLNHMGLSKDEAIIVEDSTTGLKAAFGSGAKVICRKETRYYVDQTGADYYIEDLLEILDIVK